MKFLPIGTVTIILGFVKLLICINGVTQLSMLEGYLSPPNITSYGEFVVNSIISNNYTDIALSPVFPMKLFCDMAIRQLSTLQSYTIVCVLPVNEFNEQVCCFHLDMVIGGLCDLCGQCYEWCRIPCEESDSNV